MFEVSAFFVSYITGTDTDRRYNKIDPKDIIIPSIF
jgi:hypothetical protein